MLTLVVCGVVILYSFLIEHECTYTLRTPCEGRELLKGKKTRIAVIMMRMTQFLSVYKKGTWADETGPQYTAVRFKSMTQLP